MTTIKAEPFTQYSCYVAALNSYGIGIRGSTTSVATPETGKGGKGLRSKIGWEGGFLSTHMH